MYIYQVNIYYGLFSGTDVYDKVVSICGKTQMLNVIRKLSSVVQTSQLEAFHSTLNQFHPKTTGFSYTGTYCRYRPIKIKKIILLTYNSTL